MNLQKYLMVVELNNEGYIIGITNEIPQAKKTLNELIKASKLYTADELEGKFQTHLKDFRNYKINGNNLFIENYKYGTKCGPLSSSIIAIDPETFSLELFIKERENSSYIYDDASWNTLSKLLNDEVISLSAN